MIGEKERADIMVQTVGIFHLYISSSNCACVSIMCFILLENIKACLFTLTLQEAYVSKREVGETVLYTRDTPGVVLIIIAHYERARPV